MLAYQTALNDAKAELRSNLESTWIGDLAGLTDLHKELEENAAALTMIVGNYIDENISKVAGKTGEEYSKGLKEIFDGLKVRLKDAGFAMKQHMGRITEGCIRMNFLWNIANSVFGI